jgi:hypothetical protein
LNILAGVFLFNAAYALYTHMERLRIPTPMTDSCSGASGSRRFGIRQWCA